jgi:4-amino-4-deoxy-L-arabinose transferase-like glycosyltransferase
MRPGLHLAVPLWFSFITISATFITPSGDRALLLALPAMAALSAFALPTLGRSLSALIDWFTLLFFSGCAFIIWVVWLAMQTGFPPQPAANVARLAPGFEAGFSILPFGVAVLATLSWTWLVKWRVGRHRAAIWKSLVLPAGGAALCWILLTTLWMPLLDFARSYKPLVIRIEKAVQPTQCLEVFGLRPGLMAALKFHTRMNLEPSRNSVNCPWLLVDQDIVNKTPDLLDKSQWRLFITMGHPTPGEEDIVIFQRISPVRPETEN